MKIAAVIPVAGSGKRFAGTIPKQFLKIAERPVLAITLEKILAVNQIHNVVLVCAKNARTQVEDLVSHLVEFTNRGTIVEGGKERQDSVYHGLESLSKDTDIVLVHDGVRPLITDSILKESIRVAKEDGACVAAVPVKDTIKRVRNHTVIETLRRDELWQIQTPQTARYEWLWQAHTDARKENYYTTDEAALLEWKKYPVKIIPGDYNNIKITTPEDLKFANLLFKENLD